MTLPPWAYDLRFVLESLDALQEFRKRQPRLSPVVGLHTLVTACQEQRREPRAVLSADALTQRLVHAQWVAIDPASGETLITNEGQNVLGLLRAMDGKAPSKEQARQIESMRWLLLDSPFQSAVSG